MALLSVQSKVIIVYILSYIRTNIAREVLAQSKQNLTPRIEIPDVLSTGDEDDSDEWLTEEGESSGIDDGNSEDEKEEEVEEEKVEVEEEQEEPGESLEELAAGREEKEEDSVVQAICDAAKPQEKTKPPDLRSSCMVTDISFHPNRGMIAMGNIEGEINWQVIISFVYIPIYSQFNGLILFPATSMTMKKMSWFQLSITTKNPAAP